METTNNVECRYCKKTFKKDSYLAKHQKTAKYCIIIQKKIAEKDIEDSIQNLMNAKESINKELNDLEEVNEFNNLEELEKKKIDEIHSLYLDFEKEKINIENEYKSKAASIIDNINIQNNLEEYYNLDKIKIKKLNDMYLEFETKKKEVQDKYNSIIQEEKQYEEEEKLKNNNIWKEVLKTEKLKQLEDTFELIKKNVITIIVTTEEIKHISEILTNKIFKLNDILELNHQAKIETTHIKNNTKVECDNTFSKSETQDKTKKQRLKRENEEVENKLLYHLVLLLQDQKINNETLMYIIVELMKHMNNYQIKGQDKKSCILFILRNFINTNNGDIVNKEDIKIFTDKYLEEFINIVSALSDKKIRIKLKKNCFIPLCF